MSMLVTETDAERQAIAAIRDQLKARLESGDLTVNDVASKLGLVPEGVRSLLLRNWTFEMAFRIARALDLDFARAVSEPE